MSSAYYVLSGTAVRALETLLHASHYALVLTWTYLAWHRILRDPLYAQTFVRRVEAIGVVPIKLLQFACNSMDHDTALYACVRNVCLSNVCAHGRADTMRILADTGILHLVQNIPVQHVGSGSIAQTYRCTLRASGSPCILKVRHPDNHRLQLDLRILRVLVDVVQRLLGGQGSHVDWDAFLASYTIQHDLEQESRNILRFGDIFNQPGSPIRVPRVYASGVNFILMQAMHGEHTYHLDLSLEERTHVHMLIGVAHMYSNLFHGIIHGDPHEGNILVSPDRRSISLIDFGLCLKSRPDHSSNIATHPTYVVYTCLRRQDTHVLTLSLRHITGLSTLAPSAHAIECLRQHYSGSDCLTPEELNERLRRTIRELGLPLDHQMMQCGLVHAMVLQYIMPHVHNGTVGLNTFRAILQYMNRYPVFRTGSNNRLKLILSACES